MKEQTLSPNDEQAFELWYRNKKARAYLEQKRKERRGKFWNRVIDIALVLGGTIIVAGLAASAVFYTAVIDVLING